MHFKVNRESFLSSIQRALSVLDSNSDIQLHQSVKLDVSHGGLLQVFGVSLGIRCGVASAAEVLVPGTAFLPAKRLMEVVKVLKGDVTVKSNDGSADLVISSGRSRFTLKKYRDAEYPPGIFESVQEGFQPFDAKTLFQVVKRVSASLASLEERPESNLVRIEDSDIVATDRVCLAVARNKCIPVHRSCHFDRSLLQRSLRSLGSDVADFFLKDSGEIHFRNRDSYVVLMEVVVQFPLFRQLTEWYQQPVQMEFTVTRQDFLEALSEALVAACEETRAVMMAVSDGCISLSSKSADGESETRISAGYSGDDVSVLLNGSLTHKGVQQFTSSEVHAKIVSPVRPILFYEDGYEFYVNPRREG